MNDHWSAEDFKFNTDCRDAISALTARVDCLIKTQGKQMENA